MFRLTSALVLVAGSALGQGTHALPASDFTWVGGGEGMHGVVAFHGADVRFDGDSVKGQPYSAEAVTETTQQLPDGNRITRTNRTMIYRDSEGRTRREETLQGIGPWATADQQRTVIFIQDPVEGAHYVLHPQEKTARKMPLPKLHAQFSNVEIEDGTTGTQRRLKARAAGTVSTRLDAVAGAAVVKQVFEALDEEKLDNRIIEGVEAEGTRTTLTIPAGQIGNERPIEIVSERWFSPELGVELLTTRNDPRMGTTTYRLQNIQRSEPPLTMFLPPDDYKIEEGDPFAGKVIKIRRGAQGEADVEVDAEIERRPQHDR